MDEPSANSARKGAQRSVVRLIAATAILGAILSAITRPTPSGAVSSTGERSTPTPPSSHSLSGKDLLANLRDFVLIVAALLFFAGWLFTYHYIGHFAVPIEFLDIPVHTYYFYAFRFWHYVKLSWIDLILIGLILLPLAAMLFLRRYTLFLVALLVAILFCFVAVRAKAPGAAMEATRVLQAAQLPAIQFEFRKDGPFGVAGMRRDVVKASEQCDPAGLGNVATIPELIFFGSRCRRLFLLGNGKNYFVVFYRTMPPRPGDPQPRGHIFHITMAEVIASRALERSEGVSK